MTPDPDEMPTTVDVLRYGDDEPTYVAVPGDDGTKVVGAHAREAARLRRRRLLAGAVFTGALAAGGVYLSGVAVGALVAAVLLGILAASEYVRYDGIPEVVGQSIHAEEAVEGYELKRYVDEPFVRSE